MDKIIINHGERMTEHELGPAPLVIGRDPECDLFFADKKLSRRHARIERVGTRVRLVDLGSRNGSWVNEERIEERELAAGDEIRLGGLRISFEPGREDGPAIASEREDAGSSEADQSTVYLTSNGQPPETGTVVLSREELSSPPMPNDADASRTVVLAETPPVAVSPGADDSATVFLSGDSSREEERVQHEREHEDELDETLQKPEPESTVFLEAQAGSAKAHAIGKTKSSFDTGQVLFRGQAGPSFQGQGAGRAELELELELEDAEPSTVLDRSQQSLTASVTFVPEVGFSRRSWSVRFALVVGGLVLFALFVLAFPLMTLMRPALVEESRLRARALVDLLAANNDAALAESRLQDLSLERVLREPGVTSAYVLSPAGAIVAPIDRAGETLTVDSLGGGLGDVRAIREARSSSGEWYIAQPISYRGRRVGIAVVGQRVPKAASAAVLALVASTVLLLMAAAVVVLLGRKMTTGPLDELRSDVEAFVDGRAATIPIERPYGELSLLALSLNRLLAAFPLGPRRAGKQESGTD